MNLLSVKSALVGVVKDIQSASEFNSSQVSGSTCPLKDLQSFDSLVCTEAITMLSMTLDIEIPDNVNIFVADNDRKLTIDEIAVVVCDRFSTGGR